VVGRYLAVVDPKNPYAGLLKASHGPAHRALLCLGLSGAFGVFAVIAVIVTGTPAVGLVGLVPAAVSASVGVLFGGVALVHAVSAPRQAGRIVAALGVMTLNGFAALLGVLLAIVSTQRLSRGRQLRRLDRVFLPTMQPGDAWLGGATAIAVDAEVREAVAEQWRESAKTEHASVAAFARLMLDLMAVGAPPELIAAASRDALDEIRHTEMCLSLASAIDGRQASPAPFPEVQRARTLPRVRTLALATLAVDSLIDGAFHEGVSARIIARLARRAEVPEIRDVLAQIAADEGRHAAHGWDVVDWCVREGGVAVVSALHSAARALPRVKATPLPAAEGGAWERWGIRGQALEAEEYAKAREHAVRKVASLRTDTAANLR
jgi:hypothetical protein